DLAQSYRAERRFDEARGVFDRILQRLPSSVELMIARADLEFADGKRAAGIAWLDRARGADSQAVLPRILLLSAYLETKEPGKAARSGRELEQVAPDDPRAITALAQALLANNDRLTAIAMLEHVVDMTGGAPDALVRLARMRLLDGKMANAYSLM